MGGILDTLGGVLGGSRGSSSTVSAILQLLANHRGGLGGLVNAMQDSGLGDVVSSWLANGHNLPVSADQISSVFSSTQLQQLATHFGGDQQAASDALAEHLPNIVDKLSPDGSLPQGNDWMSEAGSLLGGLLK